MIIDFHTHTFPDTVAARVADQLARSSHTRCFTLPTVSGLSESARAAGITRCLNLPVLTRPDQVQKINRRLIDGMASMEAQGVLTFGGLHPGFDDPASELRFLRAHGIRGIKIHPAFQGQDLDSPAMLRLIAAAAEEDMIIITHGGEDIGFPGHDYASVPMILRVIEEIRPPRFVIAHMGGWNNWDQVERQLAGAPVWFDTAFSLGPITAYPGHETLLPRSRQLQDDAFVRLCRRHGTDHILFATDSPWADQAEYVRMINVMPFTQAEKADIFYHNAASLLGLE